MELCLTTEPQQGASYEDQLALARAAEDLGFTGYFRSDHYMSGQSVEPLPGPTDAWTTLAGLARETSRIRLGTLMTSATHRAPGVLAVQVAQVDQMSAGRVELGLGAGWFEAEHRAWGIPFPSKRFDRFSEQLEIVSGIWGTPEGERFTFEGAHFTLHDCPALPKPAQSSVPIIVGGRGPRRTPALAARFASEFNIGNAPDDVIRSRFDAVREACREIGRDPDDLRLSVCMMTVAGSIGSELDGRVRRNQEALAGESEGATMVGDARTLAERIERFRDFGADRVYLQIMDLRDVEHIEYLGRELLPEVSG